MKSNLRVYKNKQPPVIDPDMEYMGYIKYRKEIAYIFNDDPGQQIVFYYKGKFHGCGAFNIYWNEEITDMIDYDLSTFDFISGKNYNSIIIYKCKSNPEKLYFVDRTTHKKVFCTKDNYKAKANKSLSLLA
jgi:hypothetical protein